MDIQPISNAIQQASVARERPTVAINAGNEGTSDISVTPAAPMAVLPKSVIMQPDPANQAEQVAQAIKSINKAMESHSPSLEFSIDESSKRTIVKVVDQSTRLVIRQIPTLEVLEIAKALDNVQGLLIRQKA